MLRRTLDRLYLTGGLLAALSTLTMLGVVVTQMLARWTGNVFSGGTNYAGYLMATSTFLALAYTLNKGVHIRVSLLLNRLGRWRRWGESWCLLVSTSIALYFAFYAIKYVYVSYQLKDISQGLDKTPVWIPQVPMAIGVTILAIALIDNSWRVIALGNMPVDGKYDQLEDPTTTSSQDS